MTLRLGADVAFHQRRAGVFVDADQRAREHRRSRGPTGDMDDMQRQPDDRAVGYLDHNSVRHHRAVERHHGIGIIGFEQLRLQRGIVRFEYLTQRADADVLSQKRRRKSFGANTPSTSTTRRTPAMACSFRAVAARFSAAASGAAASGSTSRISTRRSVYFQSSIRRCGRPSRVIGIERLAPEIGDLACAGQPVPRDGEDIARGVGGFGLGQYYVHHKIRISLRPRLRTGRSRKLPAPAPVPCRRS